MEKNPLTPKTISTISEWALYYGVDTSWRFKSVAKNLWLSKVQLLRGLHGGVVIVYGLVSRSECVASTDK